MPGRMLMNDILNDKEPKKAAEGKGVCKRCGHYTILTMCRMGMRVCRDCECQLEQELKRDYL